MIVHFRVTIVYEIRVTGRSNAVHPLDLIHVHSPETAVPEPDFKFSGLRRLPYVGNAQHVHVFFKNSHIRSSRRAGRAPGSNSFKNIEHMFFFIIKRNPVSVNGVIISYQR